MAINIIKKDNYLLLVSDLFSPSTERRYKASELTYSGIVTGSTLYNFRYRNLPIVELTGVDFTEFLNDGVAFTDQASFEAFMDIETALSGNGGGGGDFNTSNSVKSRWNNIDNLDVSGEHEFLTNDHEVLPLVGDRNLNPPITGVPFSFNVEVGKLSLDAINNMLDVQNMHFGTMFDARISLQDLQGQGSQDITTGIRLIKNKVNYLANNPPLASTFIDIVGIEEKVKDNETASSVEKAYHGGIEAVQCFASGSAGESVILKGFLLDAKDIMTVLVP